MTDPERTAVEWLVKAAKSAHRRLVDLDGAGSHSAVLLSECILDAELALYRTVETRTDGPHTIGYP